MKTEEFMRSVSAIDEEMIADSFDYIKRCQDRRKAGIRTRILLAAAAVLLVLCVSLGVVFALRKNEPESIEPAVTVYFEARHTVRMDLLPDMTVSRIETDGKEEGRFAELNGADAVDAAKTIVESSLSSGGLSSGDTLFLLVDGEDDQTAESILKSIEDAVAPLVGSAAPETEIVSSVLTQKEQAQRIVKEYGVSISQANLILEIMRADGDYTEDMLAKMSLSDLYQLRAIINSGFPYKDLLADTVIDMDRAFEIAKEDSKIEANSSSGSTKAENGHVYYEIVLRNDQTAVFYKIAAKDGSILFKKSYEMIGITKAEEIARRALSLENRKDLWLNVSCHIDEKNVTYTAKDPDEAYCCTIDGQTGIILGMKITKESGS